jgi:hypothetical protein
MSVAIHAASTAHCAAATAAVALLGVRVGLVHSHDIDLGLRGSRRGKRREHGLPKGVLLLRHGRRRAKVGETLCLRHTLGLRLLGLRLAKWVERGLKVSEAATLGSRRSESSNCSRCDLRDRRIVEEVEEGPAPRLCLDRGRSSSGLLGWRSVSGS